MIEKDHPYHEDDAWLIFDTCTDDCMIVMLRFETSKDEGTYTKNVLLCVLQVYTLK